MSKASLIASIMAVDPPSMVGQGTATPEIEWLVRRCLKKNPDARWQSMSDVESVLKWMAASSHGSEEEHQAPRPQRRGGVLAGLAVAAAVLASVSFFAGRVQNRTTSMPVALTVSPPESGGFTLTNASTRSAQLAVSPDGRTLAFVAAGSDGVSQIWIRPLDSTEAHPLPGTANASYPFWAPNSRSIAFFADRKLRRVDLQGGPPRALASASNGRGGAWNADDIILFAAGTACVLTRVNADGSNLADETVFGTGEVSHRWPQFLPDGRHYVFFARNPQGADGVWLGVLGGTERTQLVESGFGAIYAPADRLLYVSDRALVARHLDLRRARLTGDPIPVATNVGVSSSFYGAFSASTTGVLAYARNASAAELTWVDRAGHALGTVAGRGEYVDFQLSRDGRYLAVAEIEPQVDYADVHVLDLERGSNTRITSSRATEASPVWAPDTEHLVFRSNRQRSHDLYEVSPHSLGNEAVLLTTNEAKYPSDWSSDGRVVVYHTNTRQEGWDIMAARIGSHAAPVPLVCTPQDEVQGRISRDGRWLAWTWFKSPEKPEVYAKGLGSDGRLEAISVNGGSDPHWSADGRELFYVAPDGTLMSVAVHSSEALNPGKPQPLFKLAGWRPAPPYPSQYDVDPTGQRFLVLRPLEDPHRLPLNVLVNWTLP